MSEKKRCCATVHGSSYRPSRCSKNATVERDGKWYCGTHDPVMVKARRDAQDAKWRAGMFDELVAALHQIARKMSAFSSESRAAQIKGAVAIAEQLLAKIDERKP